MTDIPIIFSAPMVRALLDGRKTMTRRLAWRPARAGERVDEGSLLSYSMDEQSCVGKVDGHQRPSPWQKVKAGDRLWVRENWENSIGAPDEVSYKATVEEDVAGAWTAEEIAEIRWRPSIHMPRSASRLTLTIAATKIEQLQEISHEDAYAEGVVTDEWLEWREDAANIGMPAGSRIEDERDLFARLWRSLHGADAWDANPEVVALTFRVIRANIDSKEAHAA